MSTARRILERAAALGATIAILVLADAVPLRAQQQLGAIQGTITDQTGGVLPGVSVTVTNTATGVSRVVTTNLAGVYRVTSLDPGRYELAVELAGFRRAIQRDVTLSVGATLGLDFTLQAGEIAEALEVVGTSPDIQTEKADVSSVVETKKVVDLPLVARNPLALAGLQPGVVGVPSTASLFVTEQGLGINANGQRESGNNAMVDGVTISGGPWGGSMLLVPNVEAVQEFQIIANNPSAEFGRNAGAAVSIITRGGTNLLSGSVFEFHRNEGLRSPNIFERTKAPYDRNEFGVSVGGPIRRDRTFFFFSYDGLRQKGGGAALRTVESEQLVNWVRANRPNSIAAQLLQRYAPPTYPTEGLRDLGSPVTGANRWSNVPDGIPDVGTISLALTSRNIGDQFNTRVDQVLRDGNDRIRGSYYANKINNPAVYIRPQFNHDFTFLNQLFTANHSRVISNRTLNELSFGWVRQHGETGDPTPDAPTISISGLSYGFGVDFWHPITFTQNNFELRNVLTMNRGTHSFRAGGELRYGRDGATLHHWERPNYTFQSILDFIEDEPYSETRAVDPTTGLPTVAPGTYITKEWGIFFQDNWKPRPNLTLNLGIRYDNFGNPGKKEGAFNGIILGAGSTRQEQTAGAAVAAVDSIYSTDWNNVAPRVGLAWDPRGNASFVVRAGAGVSYNRINNTAYSDERLNPPLFAAGSTNIFQAAPIVYTLGPNYPPNPALGRGLDERGGIRGARVDLRVIDPDITIPTIYNWFAGVQRELTWGFVVDVNYVGSASRGLLGGDGPTSTNYNRIAGDLLDGVLNRLNPSFNTVHITESRIDASYHGIAAQVSRRYRQGLAVQVAYTVGKAEDYGGNPQELTDPSREKGAADYDVRQSLKWNVIWEIPFSTDVKALGHVLGGWQINAITVFESGRPFSVTCGLAYPRCDFNADGQSGERVNVASTDLGGRPQAEWLSGVLTGEDYTLPAQGSLATQERNAFRGPSYFNTDLSLFKNLRLPWRDGRAATVQLRVEAFNVFNRAHLNNPVSTTNDGNFGRVVSLRRDPRVIQLGAKFIF
ncbi:MAG TPA: TonB-dependent receptor [Vicinamibacterales bacterium]|nr:TonB-dependent receptor [Vicinamibacterales bacterium]